MALVAFIELVAVGVALALRSHPAGESRVVERIVKEYVPVAVPAPASDPPASAPGEDLASRPARSQPPARPVSAAAEPASSTPVLGAPPIAEPMVERLVEEARAARVRGDMRGAIVKLEEAGQTAPDDPTVLYLSAEVFETMGLYEKAADHYQKVFALGPQQAGSLFELASHKLSHGFEEGRSMTGHLALGRIRQFSDPRVTGGEKVIITIPVVSAPARTINPDLVDLKVRFFDKIDDEVREAAPDSEREFEWGTAPVDWKGTPEELLQVSYFIPQEAAVDAHLLGERRYFGHIVELRYEDELIDQQAWPRTLARKANVPQRHPLFVPEEFIPEDLNVLNPLLPPLPER